MNLPGSIHRYKTAQKLLEVIEKENFHLLVKHENQTSAAFPLLTISPRVNINSSSLAIFRK